MALTVGTKLGSHEITGLLGKGGMGEVYRARDTKLDRDVAIKVLPEVFARDAARMTRFGREAKLLAALDHPNIAAVYGLEDSGDTRALVMQLAEGPTLADRIAQGPIPIEETLPIVRQIAEALEYAHERGIIHRDLKPANVKVSANDMVKLLDFGLAKAIEPELSAESISDSPTLSRMATQAGVLLGTAAYMSPEQAKGKTVDRRADIWAFGCVLYEMLTGKMAFHGDTVTETLAAVIKEEPDWSRLPAATPVRVRVLLQRSFQKDAKRRLRDIGEARISLEEVLSGGGDPISVVREKSGAMSDLIRFEIPVPDKLTLGSVGAFALSPDGRHLAFGASSPGGLRLWVRSLDSLEVRPLHGAESRLITPFFWSADSRFLAFEAGGKLKKVDMAGGQAETICDTTGIVVGGAWSRDGVIIFGQGRGIGGIMQVSANGGAASPVTTLDASRKETWHTQPSFLPDGRHFIYLRGSSEPENTGIYVGSLDAKAEEQDSRRLVATEFGAAYVPFSEDGMGQLLFIRDGTLMAQPFDPSQLELAGEPLPLTKEVGSNLTYGFFSASNNGVLVYRTSGVTQLTWFDQRGKRLGTVGEPAIYASVALAPDGTRAAVCRADVQNANVALWLMDFGRGTSTRFTFGRTLAPVGIWSWDGSRLIFTFGSGAKYDLYQKLASGVKEHELLLETDEAKIPRSCSRDGRFLLYSTMHPTTQTRSLWVLPLEGDKKPVPFALTAFNNSEGQFSPDGRLVAYVSDEAGRDEIYVRTFSTDSNAVSSDDEGKWTISTDGGTEPRWSGDGKTLYYISHDANVMAVQITTNQPFRAGVPKVLFQPLGVVGGPFRQSWSVTPDGKRFLFAAQPEQRTASFNVVLNWPAALKK
jgi:serine/threonine protein kinase/dipeptidyl aminopeptidase/acylaminoacyl peptidase